MRSSLNNFTSTSRSPPLSSRRFSLTNDLKNKLMPNTTAQYERAKLYVVSTLTIPCEGVRVAESGMFAGEEGLSRIFSSATPCLSLSLSLPLSKHPDPVNVLVNLALS